METYDVVVIGAGSAGCVVAARLSEDPACSVLLLEAGPDYPAASLPAALLDGTHGPSTHGHDWGLTGLSGPGGHRLELPRGRVTGGSSAVNATFALRGSPADYDAWAAAGNAGWSFSDVLPAFIRLEHDLDHAGDAWHGSSGPLPIRRYLGDERSALTVAAGQALASAGVPEIPDHNAPGAVGWGPLPVNAVGGRRISTALAYLEQARARPNLVVRADTLVQEIVIRSGRATGVRLAGSGQVVEAGEVVVCAGAYESPPLLVRSGIGPAELVRSLGRDVVQHLPGVGENLVDHPAVSIDRRWLGTTQDHPVFQLVATLHSPGVAASEAPDLQLLVGGPYASGEPGVPPECFVGAALLKPRSRGRVRTRSLDPADAPVIDLGYFDEPSDLARLHEGLRLASDVVATDPLRRFLSQPSSTPTQAPEVRRWIVASAWSYHHPVGTCAMGPDPEAGAVVDPLGRVHGVDGLRVVDASIMPDIPSANTNVPTIMLAEHLVARWREPSTRGTRARGRGASSRPRPEVPVSP